MADVVLSPYQEGWKDLYELERTKLLKALGHATEGGVLFRIEHIGSTSIPGMIAKPTIDIMIDVWPFPIPEEKIRAMQELGYDYLGENGLSGRQYFSRGPHDFHVHILNIETYQWQNFLLFRNYLRADANAAKRYADLKLELSQLYPNNRQAYQNGKGELIGQLTQEAHLWHVAETGFKPLAFVAAELEGVAAPWHFSSGWALDLFTGKPSRYHDDLDIIVERQHQLAFQKQLRAKGWLLHYVANNSYVFWEDNEPIPETSHQIHARKADEFIDILIEPNLTDVWHYRRNPELTRARNKTFLERDGLSYLSPELVLAFKAKLSDNKPRPKDQKDFERVLPYLSDDQKRWLAQAVKTENANHPWLRDLSC
ncbi:MAG: GrpB family protein [Trueperaceae bacterium]|nr:GrpB family protein [Trueperaceae bacterium]